MPDSLVLNAQDYGDEDDAGLPDGRSDGEPLAPTAGDALAAGDGLAEELVLPPERSGQRKLMVALPLVR